ncbi:hypothetical protein GCM10007897_19220 [Sphingobium jiangsuense]|uniref:c-type cytochrome n=1 Tax=Sphingobium jiangsuense TaxID=870476 RepID=UPI00165DBD46|nr:c-type cytochrome [Sphingobium jiangsuense]GLT00534.1 hypothetical protein GCM10007897_19220 [Sphingobium jiangsuense]
MKCRFSATWAAALVVFLALAVGSRAEAAPPAGDALFRQKCALCHAVGGKGGKVGPDLTGVVGRKAAAMAYAYSPALRKAGVVWTPDGLDRFLQAPTRVLPGTRMVTSVPQPDQRKAIIDFLARQK